MGLRLGELERIEERSCGEVFTWKERERRVDAYLPPPNLNASRDDRTHRTTHHVPDAIYGSHRRARLSARCGPAARVQPNIHSVGPPTRDLDSEVDSWSESEGSGRAHAAAAATDDEGGTDVESRAQSDAEEGLLARAQYFHAQSDAEGESGSDNNTNQTWEADLTRMTALRKRERERFARMETIRPSSHHQPPLPSSTLVERGANAHRSGPPLAILP